LRRKELPLRRLSESDLRKKKPNNNDLKTRNVQDWKRKNLNDRGLKRKSVDVKRKKKLKNFALKKKLGKPIKILLRKLEKIMRILKIITLKKLRIYPCPTILMMKIIWAILKMDPMIIRIIVLVALLLKLDAI
jgi:hypothetical protein